MVSFENFSRLVELVYDAALLPERWPQTLTEIQASLHGCGCLLGVDVDGRPHMVEYCGYDAQAIEQFAEYYASQSYVWSCLALTGEGRIIHDRQVMQPERRARDVFANGWAREYDTTDCVILPLWKRPRLTAFTVFARSPRVGHFDQDAMETIRRLQPHFRHAAAVQARLDRAEGRSDMALSALEMMAVGVVLVSQDGEILFTNALSERLLSAHQLRCEGRIVAGRTLDETRALRTLIARAAGDGHERARSGGVLVVEGVNGDLPLVVRAVPLSGPEIQGSVGLDAPVMLLLNEVGSSAALPADLLKEAFGLTRTEAAVAGALAEGQSLQQIADHLGTARSTVASHLNALFAKTQTRRQTDLVRTLWSVPRIAPEDVALHPSSALGALGTNESFSIK